MKGRMFENALDLAGKLKSASSGFRIFGCG